MLTNTTKWSHAAGNHVVPSRWQATSILRRFPTSFRLTQQIWISACG